MDEPPTPPKKGAMDEIFRQARRNYPRPSKLNTHFLAAREVAELRRLVDSSATEAELDHFIQGQPNLLSSLLHFADTGHHGGMAYPQQTIRPCVSGRQRGLIPDYLISGESSDGTSWWVLELKGPGEKIFSGSGNTLRLSDITNKGLLQIHQYVEFCTEHQSSLRETLKLDNFSKPMGILLIGRENELSDPDRRQMKKSLGGSSSQIRIRTWDSLLRSLEHKLSFNGNIEHDPLCGHQLEDWSSDENA